MMADPSGRGWSTLVVGARFGNGAVGTMGSTGSSEALEQGVVERVLLCTPFGVPLNRQGEISL